MHLKSELFPIGIIAGNGHLPIEIARISKNLRSESYLACISDDIDRTIIQEYSHKFFSIGNVGSIINYFKSHNIKNIVFAGSISRPNLASIRVDTTGALLMAKILKQKFLGDDKLLSIVARFLEDRDFKIISAEDILSLDETKVKLSTITIPSPQDEIDIELGIHVLNTLGALDIGQAVIVEDGYVLGVEAAEGTDKLIERCALLRKKIKGGVLVKIIKPNQNIKLDVPAIGIETIKKLGEFQFSGIAIGIDNMIIINPHLTFELADKLGIFIKKV